jgi:subtilisin family serine protease
MKTMRFGGSSILLATAALLLLATGCRKEAGQTPVAAVMQQTQKVSGDDARPHMPNELIIKFKASASDSKRNDVMAHIHGQVQERILTMAMKHDGDNEGIIVVHTSLEAMEAVSAARGLDGVEYAEPNYTYNYDATSADPYFTSGQLWGMDAANTFGSQASTAWAAGHTGSANVAVGVIDEGIQYTHPDLAGQVWTNPYDPVDGIDNDGNGYVDDIHGWDFDANDNTIYDGGTKGSVDNHGTHVSGTIGANANTQGVVGMNWSVTIISAKFLGRHGGTTANAVKAVDYMTDLKTRHGINLVATNNSWGGGGFSQALSDAITRANNANILFVAAAGNGGGNGIGDDNDAKASYPSNYPQPNVIAVAAITSSGALTTFSNYGLTTVDLGAPGQGVWSTVAYNSYSSYSGTSMATPHVTGAAALYAATHTGATAAQIKTAILSAATPTASLSGKCVTGGRLNVSGF